MKFLSYAAIMVLFVITSCCSASKTKTDNTMTENTAEYKTMVEDGFTLGTIVASKVEGDCPFVIASEIDGNEVMYDPINLDDSYKKGGMKVWYKYNPLRMMNRCEKANPVSIADIQEMK
jgi:hypothetical protein